MTWWTEPDPDRRAQRDAAPTARLDVPPNADADADGAVTVSFDGPSTTVRLDAQDAPTAAFTGGTPTAATVPLDAGDGDGATRIMPTALIPDEGPRPNDAPTVAVQRLATPRPSPSAGHAPPRIPVARPLDAGAGPWSPLESRAARSHRTSPGLGALGLLRLLVGQAGLAIGVLLVCAGFGTAVDADLGSVWNVATGAGLGIVALSWIVLPGSVVGAVVAILLTAVAWVVTVVGLWVLATPQLQDVLGAEATQIVLNWVAPAVALTLAATAWITRRGKHPAAIVVLALPIVVAVAAGLVVPDGWLFGAWPSELLAPVVDAVAPVVASWFEPWPAIAARIPAGVDGWLRIAIAVAPAMLLAWPLRGRR